MPIKTYKIDYDQKTVFEGSASKLAREVEKGYQIAVRKYGWPEIGFRAQINSECRRKRIKTQEAKTLDFNAKVDDDFPVEFE